MNERYCNIIASNHQNEQLTLRFRFMDHDVVRRWADLVERNKQDHHTLSCYYSRVYDQEQLEQLIKRFKSTINYINSHYDRTLDQDFTLATLSDNSDVLNDLHEEYEIYGQRLEQLIASDYFTDPESSEFWDPVWPGQFHNTILHEKFLLLNNQIHEVEGFLMAKTQQEEPPCHAVLDYLPSKYFELLEPVDYFLFNSAMNWGWLYLGFNTLGKNWLSALNDNDIECVIRKQIKPQQRFSAEAYVFFTNFYAGTNNSYIYNRQILFHNWWRSNNFSEHYDPTMTISDLAFGYIPLATCDAYAINNEPMIRTITITDRNHWNKTVWSRFDRITDIIIL